MLDFPLLFEISGVSACDVITGQTSRQSAVACFLRDVAFLNGNDEIGKEDSQLRDDVINNA